MQVAGVDADPARQLAVRERLVSFFAEHLDHTQA
jgi:hypothetical protein